MGNEGLLGLSPAHRRGPFRRTASGPDLGWRSLVHRHKFLLSTLGLLTLLCTIYLYFAITLGTRDSCSGLGGVQRALCQVGVKAGKANTYKSHLRRLMFVSEEDSDPSEETGTKQNMEDFFTVISNLASGRRAGLVHVMSPSSKIPSMEQCIGPFKAMLDWVDEKQPKSIEDGDNLEASKASKASHHWRGNLF